MGANWTLKPSHAPTAILFIAALYSTSDYTNRSLTLAILCSTLYTVYLSTVYESILVCQCIGGFRPAVNLDSPTVGVARFLLAIAGTTAGCSKNCEIQNTRSPHNPACTQDQTWAVVMSSRIGLRFLALTDSAQAGNSHYVSS